MLLECSDLGYGTGRAGWQEYRVLSGRAVESPALLTTPQWQ